VQKRAVWSGRSRGSVPRNLGVSPSNRPLLNANFCWTTHAVLKTFRMRPSTAGPPQSCDRTHVRTAARSLRCSLSRGEDPKVFTRPRKMSMTLYRRQVDKCESRQTPRCESTRSRILGQIGAPGRTRTCGPQLRRPVLRPRNLRAKNRPPDSMPSDWISPPSRTRLQRGLTRAPQPYFLTMKFPRLWRPTPVATLPQNVCRA
jgi:hypothetical protein